MEKLEATIRKIRVALIATVACTTLIIAFLLGFLPVDDKVPATGVVLAETDQFLYSPDEGLIESVAVADGAPVRKGDPILMLDCSGQVNAKSQIEAELKEANSAVELKQTQLEKIAKLPLPKEFWHARSELSEAQERSRYTALELDRYRQLIEAKLTSQSDYDARKLADDMAQSELGKVRERVAILDKGLEETIKKEALGEYNTAVARLERLKTDLRVCQEAIERRRITAPMDGRLTFLAKRRPGERVQKGEELAHLASGEANRARLMVGESQVHRIKAGQTVRMRSNTFDLMKFGYIDAHVDEVALEPGPRGTSETGPGEARYRVMVRIDRTPLPLTLGSTLDAKIILRRVSLWRMLLPERSAG